MNIKQIAVEVKDIHGRPVPGLELRAKGATSGTTTDIEGIAVLPVPSTMPRGALALELVNPAKPLVVISPCGAVVAIAQSTRTVVLAKRADPGLLSSPLALASLAGCILRASPPLEKYQPAEYPRHRRQALVSISRSIGVTPSNLDQAIRAWARKTTDPFDRGLGALYGERPRDAANLLLQALRIPNGHRPVTAKLSAGNQDRVGAAEFYLGRALYAERRFAESEAPMNDRLQSGPMTAKF